MYCPKCGNNVEEGIQVCSNCGLDFSTVNSKSEVVAEVKAEHNSTPVVEKKESGSNILIKVIYFGLAAVVLVMFFMAASSIADGGSEIMQIQSVGGQTLEEAYYSELGTIYSGYAMIARALGIFFASVLAWFGLKK